MTSSSPPVSSRERTSRSFPLTTVERRFWMLHHLHPAAPVANIGRVVELSGDVYPEGLARAFLNVAENPVLRMRVREERGEPRGWLGEPPRLQIVHEVADAAAVARAVDEVVKAPYDLEKGPLCRARLMRRASRPGESTDGADDRWVLVLGAHHLILDGWGLSRSLPRALAKALRNEGMTFGDEAALDDESWIEARFARAPDDPPDDARAKDGSWYQQHLSEATPLSLPLVRPPPPRSTGLAHDVEVTLAPKTLERAEALAKTVGARGVHVFLAAFVTELARSGRSRDLLIGTTAAARPPPVASSAGKPATDNHEMGCFVRTKALRVLLDEHAPFVDVVKACRLAVRDSLDHPAFDAEELHTIGAPPVGALFNFIPFSAFDGEVSGVDVKAGRIIAGGTAFPISLTVDAHAPHPDSPARLVLEVDADLFDVGFAARFAERIKTVLEDALARPEVAYTRLRRLGPTDEVAREKNAPNAAELAPVKGGHLVPLIEHDLDDGVRPALIYVHDPHDPSKDEVISRRELLERVRSIAASIDDDVDGHDGDGAFVGVQCENPLRSVEGIFGVLFSNRGYVPIDPHAPPLRKAAIVEQARLPLVLDDADVLRRGALGAPAKQPEPSTSKGKGKGQSKSKAKKSKQQAGAGWDGKKPAYVIFTSGSTGNPKGVVVSHDAVVAQLQARVGLGFTRPVRSALLAPFFFDGSVETLFWSFMNGATMHVLSEEARRDPIAIRATLSRRRITYTSAVPALWGAMLDAAPSTGAGAEPLDALEFTIVGGEKLTSQLIEKHNLHTTAWLVNEYGPTETTVLSSAWSAPKRGQPVPDRIPIGRSSPHVRCAVVDENLEPVPCLEAGELVVSGMGLAEGYLNAPELTEKAFVTLPATSSAAGTRIYRTGDVVRLWPDGDLEWLARKDDQVKLRGVRVEPGEVEAALMAEGADEAAVLVDNNNLVAWVAPETLDETTLIAALHKRLPEAMVPARIMAMKSLPKTANDKIDKRNLPKLAVDDVVTLAATPLERTIAAVWSEVLAIDPVSVTRSFFAYGGHSLKAAVVVRKLSDQLGREVPLSALMVARTVRELARSLGGDGDASPSSGSALLLPLTPRGAGAPRVVFLPGIGGHVFTFAGIADRMKVTAAGLRAWGAEPGEEPLPTVEDLAAKNLEELEKAGVGDDVVFAGYSFGGLVAYEMALQRSAAGRPPRHLVIFDTMAPGYPKKLPPWVRARLHAESLAKTDWAGRMSYLKDRFDSVKEKLNLKLQRADAFKDGFALNPDELAALAPAQRAQLEKLAGVTTLAHHRYWPRASTSVPMTLFAAEQDFDWAATIMDDPIKGWRAWVTGPVKRVTLSGDHLRLFVEENLTVAAAALDAL